MHIASGPIAHGLIGRQGKILDVDSAYAALLGMRHDALVGRQAVDFAHPADRVAVAAVLRRAWNDDGTTSATLRHVRADGAAIWVNVHISRIGRDDTAQLVVSCRQLPVAPEVSAVADNWQMARLLLLALEGGKRAFGDTLIANPATEILLIAYLAEAEAQSVTPAAIARRIHVGWPLARRWLMALADAGFVESERAGPMREDGPVRLTPRAHAMIEALFGGLVTAANGPLVPA